MQVFVKLFNSRTIVMDVEESMTVYEVKKLVYEREGIPPNQYRFIKGMKVLEDSRALSESMIDHRTTLHMMIGLQGGK